MELPAVHLRQLHARRPVCREPVANPHCTKTSRWLVMEAGISILPGNGPREERREAEASRFHRKRGAKRKQLGHQLAFVTSAPPHNPLFSLIHHRKPMTPPSPTSMIVCSIDPAGPCVEEPMKGGRKPLAPLPVLVTEADLPLVLAVVAGGITLTLRLALLLDAWVIGDAGDTTFYYPKVGYFLIAYMFMLAFSRFRVYGTYVLYELLWGCNVSLAVVTLAVFLSKPFLVGVAMAIVSGDQLFWYVDIVGYLLVGKLPIGVLKYLTYPENRSFSKTVFGSHHLWFLPLCLWLTTGHGGMHVHSFAASCVVTASLASYCRYTTPFQVKLLDKDDAIYLNVNGAFEFWKDIHVDVLHKLDNSAPLLYLLYLSIVGNLLANGLPHAVLLLASMGLNA